MSTALVVVLGMNVGSGESATAVEVAKSANQLPVWASATVGALGTYLGLLFLMVIRKLWGAYEVANEFDQRHTYLHS